jgi:hypothetical protein
MKKVNRCEKSFDEVLTRPPSQPAAPVTRTVLTMVNIGDKGVLRGRIGLFHISSKGAI